MTMPAQNPTAAQVQAPGRQSVDDRAAALISKLEGGSPSESADETSEAPSTSTTPGERASTSSVDSGGDKPVETQASPEESAAKKRNEERLARIAAAIERERREDEQRKAHRTQRSKERETTGELEKLRARLKELEPLNEVFKDEEAFLGAAETRGYSAERMINYWRKRMTDPQAVAAQQTAHAEKRMLEELAKRDQEIAKLRQEVEAKETAAREQAEGVNRATQFVHKASSLVDTHPLTADFLQENGPQTLIAFANEYIAPSLPERYELEDLHDHLEQFLYRVGRQPRMRAASPPANGTSQPPKKNGAEKPVTTLSNAATAERAQVTEEIPLHRLPLEERKARLKAKLAREDG
jgi:hypothetical protein